MGDMEVATQGAGAGLAGELAAERLGQIRVGLRAEREAPGPERERRRDQRREEELQERDHANVST